MTATIKYGHTSLTLKLHKVYTFYYNLDDNNGFITVTSYGLLSQNDKPMGIVVHTCNLLDIY